ncbi:hypothetical protein DYH09_00500, partial [bacterium CPR1]|nr:hypothetical protein [bacterium CPR1]
MFDFLKRPQPVELVEISAATVTFRSKKAHPEGKVLRIRFDLTDGSKRREFKLAVMVQSCRPHTDKQFVCVSQVLETRSLSSIYAATQEGLNQAGEAARRKARLPARLRVVSHGIHALSKDFNADGMQLEVLEPVEVGTQMVLTVELQTTLFPMLLVPAGTALYRLAPPAFLASHTFFFHKGQRLDEAALRSQLTLAGYEHVSQVVHPGEYCVRGGLIDLYPMGSALPYRLDLFGDEIDSIRTFDPDTQRSLYAIDRVRLLPGREFPMDEAARTAFRSRWRERFEGDPSRSTVYRDVGNGIAPAGIEYWLPLFHDGTATLFDYLPATTVVVSHGDVEDASRRFADEAGQRFRFLSHDPERPLLRPDELFIDGGQFFVEARRFGRWSIARPEPQAPVSEAAKAAFAAALPDVAVNRRAPNPVERLAAFLEASPLRKLIVAE